MQKLRNLRIPRWYWILSLQVLNIILLFAAVNVALFVVFSIRDGFRGSAAERSYNSDREQFAATHPGWSDEDLAVLWTERQERRLVYRPFTQLHVPLTEGRYYNVSEHGFRLVKNQGPWPPDPSAFNVFMFGGSTTFGTNVTDDQTISSFLQEFLSDNARNHAFVYNFGVPGYFTTQERVLFEDLALSGTTPDVAVFIDGLNDFSNPEGEPQDTETFRHLVNASNEEQRRSWGGSAADAFRALPINSLANRISGQLEKWPGTTPEVLSDETASSR